MRQDSFVTTALKASEYIQKNKNYFLGGAAGIIAIILVIYFISYSSSQKLSNSEILFGQAQLAAAMGQTEQSIASFKNLMEQYGSTKAADRACYYAARIYFDSQNFDSALVYYQLYIDKYGKEPVLLGAAYAGAATCYEALDDNARAGEYFMQAADISSSDYASPNYLMSAGRTFRKAGMPEQAKQAYQKIIDDYRTSTQYALARKFLEEVEYANK